MKINKIQISAFGKLKNFELCPTDKLNLIHGDNEAGKSTVMAFIKMALYGSTVRGSGLDNPRVKYLPFDSSAMGGNLYFSHNRINYRLECKFGATPAKDKIMLFNDDTGEQIALGAGKTVGEYFFDLSSATFESTAFIQSIALNGGADEIARHLSTTGSAQDGATPELIKKRLTAAKESQFTKRRVGAGDRLRDKIEQTQTQLAAEKERARILRETKENLLQKQADKEQLKQKRDELSRIVALSSDLRRRSQLKEYIDICQSKAELEKQCRGVDRSVLDECNKKLWDCNQLKANLDRAKAAANDALLDANLQSFEQIDTFFEQASSGIENQSKPVKTKNKLRIILLILGALFALCGIALSFVIKFLPYVPIAIGIILILIGILKKNKAVAAADPLQAQRKYEKALNLRNVYNEYKKFDGQYKSALDNLLCDIKQFAPNADITTAQQEIEKMTELVTALQDKTSSFSALSLALGVSYEQASIELDAMPDCEINEKQVAYAKDQIATIDHTLNELVKSTAALGERINAENGTARPGAAQLERDIEDMKAELSQRIAFASAADLASEVLSDSYSELRQSFGPELEAATAELFAKLTGGKYNQIKVAHDLSVTTAEQGSFNLIDADYLSAGTADQAYIALRLAIARILANGQLPIFLDDPFLQFDAKRETAAFNLLNELSQNQQFIFFTCRNDTLKLAENINANIIDM